MVVRPYPPAANIDSLSRQEIIDQIIGYNEVSTFTFSERWLRKQRITRLRDLLQDLQDRAAEVEEEPTA